MDELALPLTGFVCRTAHVTIGLVLRLLSSAGKDNHIVTEQKPAITITQVQLMTGRMLTILVGCSRWYFIQIYLNSCAKPSTRLTFDLSNVKIGL